MRRAAGGQEVPPEGPALGRGASRRVPKSGHPPRPTPSLPSSLAPWPPARPNSYGGGRSEPGAPGGRGHPPKRAGGHLPPALRAPRAPLRVAGSGPRSLAGTAHSPERSRQGTPLHPTSGRILRPLEVTQRPVGGGPSGPPVAASGWSAAGPRAPPSASAALLALPLVGGFLGVLYGRLPCSRRERPALSHHGHPPFFGAPAHHPPLPSAIQTPSLLLSPHSFSLFSLPLSHPPSTAYPSLHSWSPIWFSSTQTRLSGLSFICPRISDRNSLPPACWSGPALLRSESGHHIHNTKGRPGPRKTLGMVQDSETILA